MNTLIEFIRTDVFLLGIAGINIILLILFISNNIKLRRVKKEYKNFMIKLGNGNNIDEMLKSYISKVEELTEKSQELTSYCNNLEKDISKCIQKTGIVRYSAFKGVGSDLSFALALLDENNSGVVLNGIYAADASNIYAKLIINGKSKYTITEVEQEAINLAINSEETHKIVE